MRIGDGDPDHPAVAALLRLHLAEALATTPREHAHALDLDGFRDPAIRLFAAWHGDALAGVVALRTLGERHGEVKAMRTAPGHRRRGVARGLMAHLLAEARARGYTRVSLETGTAPAFAAANRLYEARGFVDAGAFGGYRPSEHNRFMTLALEEPPCPASS